MIQLFPAAALAATRHGTADLRCHFPFADLTAAPLTHWGRLRVANTVTLGPEGCFDLGREEAMEILTFVVSGTLQARVGPRVTADEQGAWLHAGDLHQISCGEGAAPFSWTAGPKGAVLFQAWLLPEVEGGVLETAIRRWEPSDGGAVMAILASGFPEDAPEDGLYRDAGVPVPVRTYARLLSGSGLPGGVGGAGAGRYDTLPTRFLYLVILSGTVTVNGTAAAVGDRLVVTGETRLSLGTSDEGRFLLIDTD